MGPSLIGKKTLASAFRFAFCSLAFCSCAKGTLRATADIGSKSSDNVSEDVIDNEELDSSVSAIVMIEMYCEVALAVSIVLGITVF